MNGIINILKPPNMTSHDVVGFLRRITRIKRIGHTGTLDPNAAGVLPVCIGKATRVAEYFNSDEIRKKYRAELTLGSSTDTQDSYGTVVEKSDFEKISVKSVLEAFSKFEGEIEQIPPMYSAKKVGGRKLYELAREGIEVERKKRLVNIYSLDIVNSINSMDRIDSNTPIMFDVECSSGTYVRTICNDIGEALETMGYMSFLLRTDVGPYNLGNSYTLKEVEELWESGKLEGTLFPVEHPLCYMNELIIDDSCFEQILNGVKLPINKIVNLDSDFFKDYKDEKSIEGIDEEINFRVYCKGLFIGVGGIRGSIIKMKKVLYDSKDGI